ncbi:MAG TPA: glycosyltransferase family 4 protein [Candidatus Saccharimonadia bacterium]|nr:glycosyltransferase family 4 protein [Candidatus Saccharimonadia bacterium]
MNIVWFNFKDLDHPQAGGAEVVNEELAARLAAAGHTVTFLVAGFPGGAPTTERRGFRVIRTGNRFSCYLAAGAYFRRHRAELAADLVIDECNTMPFFAGFYARTRTVLFFHMLCRRIWFYELPQPFSTIGYLLEPLYLRLLNRGNHVITVSESTKKDLMRHGYTAGNISLISEAIQLAPVASLGSVPKFPEPTLLSHGSIRPMKRTLDQIKAFELAKAYIPNLRLIVSGDATGAYGQQVLSYIKASPHADSIKYAGRTTEAEKITLMRKCHALLVTSVKEGWGLVVTEAASQGTPAVVYDVDGLRDSVRAGTTGLVTSANTPAALAASVQELLGDPARYERMRSAGWEWSKSLNFDQSYKDFAGALGIGQNHQ